MSQKTASTKSGSGGSRSKSGPASLQTAPIKADPSAVIYDTATLVGKHPITIGAHSVIHPRATILSHAGPVTIGDYCIVCERSVVGYPEVRDGKAYVESSGAGVTDNSEPPESLAIDIGSHVRIEPFAQVMASVVKDGCILDVYSVVRQGAILGKHCHVGVRCEVSNGEEIGDNAVLYWLDTKQRKRYNNTGLFELEKINQEKHCQVLGQLWQASRKGKA